MSEKLVAVVGGSGFVGYSLANHLKKSFLVRIVDKRPPPSIEGFDYQQCDITKFGEVRQALEDVDFVIHTAIVQIPLINENKRMGYEVNILGTQNVCEAVNCSEIAKGFLLTGTWHVFGERNLHGIINEEFGFKPDNVEKRAQIYALCKVAQEAIVRFYDAMSEKVYGVIRLGTVLGEGMPEKTAANIFISKGLKGEALTPYKHSMNRLMLYVDIEDVCLSFEIFARNILDNVVEKSSMDRVLNLFWPHPITIFNLAHMIAQTIDKQSGGRIKPNVEIVETQEKGNEAYEDKGSFTVDITKMKKLLNSSSLTDPSLTIEKIVKNKLNSIGY